MLTAQLSQPYDVNLTNQVESYLYYHPRAEEEFRVVRMSQAGTATFYVQPLVNMSLSEGVRKGYREFPIVSGEDVLSVGKSNKEYCEDCYYLITVYSLRFIG